MGAGERGLLGRLRFVFRHLSGSHRDAVASENRIVTCDGREMSSSRSHSLGFPLDVKPR